MKKDLGYYIESLTHIFKKNQPREAHAAARALFLEMAENKQILFEIVQRNLLSSGFFLQKRINPVIALKIVDNAYITLVAHFWMPLPDRNTTVTHQSIHHHGRLLLTSVAPYGPGYNSIIFKKGFSINADTGETAIQIEKEYHNPLYNLEFIDTNTPHIVFYPEALSVTYAAWTYDQRSALDKIRKNPFLQKNKKRILQFMNYFKGLKSNVNTIEYFDFYPDGNVIRAMKDRVMYPAGSNQNFIQNVFYILQQIGFTELTELKKAAKQYPDDIQLQLLSFIQQLEQGKEIRDIFEDCQLNIPKINFSRTDLLHALK